MIAKSTQVFLEFAFFHKQVVFCFCLLQKKVEPLYPAIFRVFSFFFCYGKFHENVYTFSIGIKSLCHVKS